ncbi:MAG: tetratricopeptide repeat protein [Kangiellaceae bacterium]|jgi:TPR repeat protein|nr:tetratricopeptide repeat protein [Kangiellaceae bacterium]
MTVRVVFYLFLVLSTQLFASSSSYRQGIGTSMYFTQLGELKHRAELGDPNAQFLLGNLYFTPPEGTSIKPNLGKAADYYFQAAIRDHVGAQYNLGVLYFQGKGVPENWVLASAWFDLAAKNQSKLAKSIRKKAENSLAQLTANFNKEQLQEAKTWTEKYHQVIVKKLYRTAKLPKL